MGALAACHVHSKWSYDGSWLLEDLVSTFSRRGYRVLLMTEHDRGFSDVRLEKYRAACRQVSTDRMLVVPGIEYSDAANCVHVLVWGPVPFLGENRATGDMLDAARRAGGAAVLAHPTRRKAWEHYDRAWTDKLVGIEVWNRKSDGWTTSATAPALLQTGRLMPFVGLDFHTQRQSFPLAMALDVEGPLTEASVLECLHARRCQPRAFGLPLESRWLRQSLPVLRTMEIGRRAAARWSRQLTGGARR